MSYRAWEPNAIGTVVPPFAGSNGGGGGGAQTQDHQAPVIIVGNASSGDTAFVCDFLDPGDGSGIAAAIAAATGKRGAIWLRAGLYDLNLGAVATPFVVPAGWAVMGASPACAEILARHAGEQEVFTLGSGELRDLAITGQAPTGFVTGTQYVSAASGATLRNVFFQVQTAAGGVLKSALFCTGKSVRVSGCAFDVAGQNQAVALVANAGDLRVTDCRFAVDNLAVGVTGDDIMISGCVGTGGRFARLSGSRVAVDNVSWDVNTAIGGPAAGQACLSLSDCALATVAHFRASNPFGFLERGVELGGLAAVVESRSLVSACALRDFAVGVLVDPNQQNNIVLGNTIQGAATPVSDLGTGTNVASNVF